jgi:YD repeat-containing protein
MMLVMPTLSYAQQDAMKGYLQTPNVASLGIFDQVPVSPFTGVPQIHVPLYTLEENGIIIPIALDYHVNLVKPNNHPGWVGLGWNLTAGGAITRIPNGHRDETDDREITLNYNNRYYQLNKSDWYNQSGSSSLPDWEPDEFMFNFGNYSGSFFKNHEGQWQVRSSTGVSLKITEILPNENISIYINDRSNNDNYNDKYNYNKSYYQFTITTEDGAQYIFGGSANSFEGNHNIIDTGYSTTILPPGYIDTWFLRKIITPDRREINFEYNRGSDLVTYVKFNAWGSIFSRVNSKEGCHSFIKECILKNLWRLPITSCTCSWGTYMYNVDIPDRFALLQTTAYLQSISSDHYKIDFYSSESTQLVDPIPQDDDSMFQLVFQYNKRMQLDSVCIKTANNIPVKKAAFTYTNTTTERLKLTSVTESGDQPIENSPVHTFYYNSTKLPAYGTKKMDYWGYYNGKEYNLSVDGISNRSFVDSVLLKAEILEKITYPTGGQAEFEYEPHEFSSYVNRKNVLQILDTVNTLTGGLRIRKIKLLDNNQSLLKETTYLYKKNYVSGETQSSGILAGIPVYADMFEFENGSYVIHNDYIPGPLSYTNGSYITYSEVVEKVAGNGFSIHTFTNFDTDIMYRDRNPLVRWGSETEKDTPISSLAYIRGKSLTQSIYSENGKMTKKIVNEYNSLSENEYVRAISVKDLQASIISFPYRIYTGKHNLVKQTIKTYSSINTDSISTTETYSYNSHNLVSETSLLRSDGKKQKTKFVYPFEIIEGTDTTIMRKMTDKNMFSNVIEKVSYLNDGKVIDGEHRKYSEVAANAGIFKPVQIDLLPQTGTTTIGNLYPSRTVSKNLFLMYAAPPGFTPDYVTENFTIEKYPTNVQLNLNFAQQAGFIPYSPRPLCFILTISGNNGYSFGLEAIDGEVSTSGVYVYQNNIDLNLLPGNYTITLTHASRYDVFKHLQVGYEGTCEISFTEQTLTMAANYSLLQPEIYYKYNTQGNVIESKPAGSNVATTYLWGYNYQYPIAEIKNATYSDVLNKIQEGYLNSIAARNHVSYSDSISINNLRTLLPNAQITTYMYKPLIGIETIIDPRGVKITYEYDAFGRLLRIKDENNKTIETYDYHYKN